MAAVVDGKDVSTVDGLRDAIAAHKPGDTVELTVGRPAATGRRSTSSWGASSSARPPEARRGSAGGASPPSAGISADPHERIPRLERRIGLLVTALHEGARLDLGH